MKFKILAIFILSTILSSCATIFGRSSDEVSFTSIPAGAKVYNGDKLLGTTPFKHTFDRDTFNHIHVTIRKDGYESQKFMMKKTLAKPAIFNLTSVLSWGTDALSGNMMEYSPKSYLLELKKQGRTTRLEKRQAQLVKLIALGRHNFFEDVARGEGETLNGLFHLYDIKEQDRVAKVQSFKSQMSDLMMIHEPVELSSRIEQIL